MVNLTTTTEIPAPIQNFYDRVLLERATPYLAHELFGQKRPIDLKSGNTAKFRRYESLTPATAPLVEGVTPTAQQLSKTDVTKTLAQYGTYVWISDMVEYTSQDPVLTERSEILGENAGETIDIIIRDDLAACTSVYYANGVGARGSVATVANATDLGKIVRAMRVNKAKYWNTMPIPGSTRIGTTPIPASYYAICSPQVQYDLETTVGETNGFVPVQKYPEPSKALPNEFGACKNIRFVMSENATVHTGEGDGGADVHVTYIFGQNAYGIVPLAGKALEMIAKSRGHGDDYLDQRSTAGWKATTAGAVILNSSFMYAYETLVTA